MKDLTGLQIGHIYVIKKQYNPNVKVYPDKYWLVECKGKQKLMRYDNILIFGGAKEKEMKHIKTVSKISPKEAILKAIQSGDDMNLGAIMLCISLDITNKLYELKRFYPKSYFVPLHHYIEDYMKTERFNI